MPNTTGELLLADDHLVADFPYDSGQVREIKMISGAAWDKVARVWRLPISSIEESRRFADRHKFYISPDVMKFTIPGVKISQSRVWVEESQVFVEFPYDPVMVEVIRRVENVTFSKSRKVWEAPLSSLSDILELAGKFSLVVDSGAINAHRKLSEAERRLVDLSSSTDAELDLPEVGGTLRPYQRSGIAYALEARRCFIADEMGTGKTIQSLVALEASNGYPAVVVCPPTLTLNWASEASVWVPGRTVSLVENRKDFPEPADITIVGWSNISTWSEELAGATSYIFDESHYAKTPNAQRTKAAIKMAKGAPGLILCLTGTPITNRPAEFAPQLDILGRLGDFGGQWKFYKRYCGAFRDRFGVWHTDGASHLDELHERLRGSCYVRRTKDQVLDDLPPMLHNRILVTPDPKVMRDYRRAEDDIARYMADRAAEIARELGKSPGSAAVIAKIKAEANEHLVRIAALRRLAALAKMSAVDEWVGTLLESGAKVVLAAHHRDIVNALAEKFGGLKIQGGMLVQEVEAHKSQFMNEPEARVITLSIQAAKTGHTLTAAQDIAFVELPFTPADLDQTAARCHRIGQAGVVTAHYILAAGTIDEKIDRLIAMKRSVVDAATDGTVATSGVSVGSELVAAYLQMGLES